jgi:hypothetical protein
VLGSALIRFRHTQGHGKVKGSRRLLGFLDIISVSSGRGVLRTASSQFRFKGLTNRSRAVRRGNRSVGPDVSGANWISLRSTVQSGEGEGDITRLNS